MKIKEKHLLEFFQKLPPPMGMQSGSKISDVKKKLLKMGIKTDNGFIYFNELLYRLMREQYCKFKLNKRMTLVELTTQFKLY